MRPEADGRVGLVVGSPDAAEPWMAGELRGGSAWSTIKVPIALALLRAVGGPDGLSAAQRQRVESALTASDNAAAAALFDDLGEEATAAVSEVLRAAGDDHTIVSTQGRDGFSPYGQTDWSLVAQHRFMTALLAGQVSDAAPARHVLDLMARVTSDSWGLGSLGVPARWKGGWGPGTDGSYLARQMGVIELDDRQLVVALAAGADDGQYATAQAMATEVAERALQEARQLSR